MEGWLALPERFDDEGESGSTLERPALDRLPERIEEGRVDRVVICRLDRITRSLMDWVKLAELLKRHNVCLGSISGEGLDRANDALVQLMANMIATFAEFERGLISERLRDAKAAKRRRGLRCAGVVPCGFTVEPAARQLKPVPAECEVVRKLFERAAAGAMPVEIAGWLNEQGVTTKRQHRTQGEPVQQGGVFVLARGGGLLHQYVSREAGDHPDNADLLHTLDEGAARRNRTWPARGR